MLLTTNTQLGLSVLKREEGNIIWHAIIWVLSWASNIFMFQDKVFDMSTFYAISSWVKITSSNT